MTRAEGEASEPGASAARGLEVRAGAALALRPDAVDAAREATRAALRRAGLRRAAFAIVACGAAHRERAAEVGRAVAEAAQTEAVVGAAVPGFAILEGPGVDDPAPVGIRGEPAVAVLLAGGHGWSGEGALLPDASSVDLGRAIALLAGEPGAGGAGGAGGARGASTRFGLLLAPPLGFRHDRFAAGVEAERERFPLVGARLWQDADASLEEGGLSEGAALPSRPVLSLGPGKAAAQRAGLLVVHRGLTLDVEPLVGAAPIGRPTVVTRGGGRAVETLGGRPALSYLALALDAAGVESAFELAPGRERILAGVAKNPGKRALGRGDYAVLPIAAYDAARGSIEVDGEVRLGQTFAFQLRDPPEAPEAVAAALARLAERSPAPRLGVYLGGRGGPRRRLEATLADLAAVRARWPSLPVLGLLTDGELAPRESGCVALREGAVLALAR